MTYLVLISLPFSKKSIFSKVKNYIKYLISTIFYLEKAKEIGHVGELFQKEMEDKEEFFKEDEENIKKLMETIPKFKDKLEYVEREENVEMETELEKQHEKFMKYVMSDLKEGDQIHNFIPFHKDVKSDKENSITESGVYVLKDGKLVKGEGRKKEEVLFSNWY